MRVIMLAIFTFFFCQQSKASDLQSTLDNIERNQKQLLMIEYIRQAEAAKPRYCSKFESELAHWKKCSDSSNMTEAGKRKMKNLCFTNWMQAWNEAHDSCGTLYPLDPPDIAN